MIYAVLKILDFAEWEQWQNITGVEKVPGEMMHELILPYIYKRAKNMFIKIKTLI